MENKQIFIDKQWDVETLLNNVFDGIQDGISVLDKDLNIIRVNKWMEEMYADHIPIVGKKCYTVYQNRTSICPWCPCIKTLQSGRKERTEVPYPEEKNPIGWINLTSYPLKNNNGDIIGIIESVRDITEQKKIENHLKENRELLDLAMSVTNNGIWDWHLDTNDVFFDKRYFTMAGYSPDEFPHRLEEFQKRVHPNDIEQVMSLATKYLSGEVDSFQVEFRFKNKNGEWMWIQGAGKIVERDDKGKPKRFVGTHTDITSRKCAEEQAERARKDRELLFEASSNGIRIITKDFKVKMMNKKMADIIQTPIEEGIGLNCSIMFGSKWCGTNKCSMKRVLENGKGFVEEDTRKIKNGKEIIFIDSVTPYYDDSGNIIGIIEDFRDITPIKEAEEGLRKAHNELKKMNTTLEQKVEERTQQINHLLNQKDEFINQLGHDLKNPLGPFLQLLPVLKKHVTNSKDRDIIDVLNRNADYMNNLVKKTIELAKLKSDKTIFNFENVELYNLIENVILANSSYLNEYNISVKNNVSKRLSVSVDPFHIQELVMNLLNNAIKYSMGPGIIEINTHQKNENIIVSIRDTGIGLSHEQMQFLFDEYYKADSSRHDFDSTGLGLPICKRIIERHGGEIWVESEGLGKGSTFYFSLPV